MIDVRLDGRTGGAAVALGYVLLLVSLFRDPSAGWAAATASPRGSLYFVVFPIAGIAAGGYAVLGGRYGGLPLFVAANYLAVFGLALMAGFALAPATAGLLGIGLFALALLGVLVSLRRLLAYLRIGTDTSAT